MQYSPNRLWEDRIKDLEAKVAELDDEMSRVYTVLMKMTQVASQVTGLPFEDTR